MPQEHRTRDRSFILRMTDEERKKLSDDAEKAGLTQNAYLISLLNGAEVKERVNNNFIDLVKLMTNVATNLNQVSAKLNTTGFIDVAELKKEREKLLRILAKMEQKYLD